VVIKFAENIENAECFSVRWPTINASSGTGAHSACYIGFWTAKPAHVERGMCGSGVTLVG